jgi:AcrR family transcriptional regulator
MSPPVVHTKQPAETRQRLLEEAAKAILDKGLAGMTLDAVAKGAGVSKGGLLHHFPSKQLLVDALVSELFNRFVNDWKQLADADPVRGGRWTRAYLKLATEKRDECFNRLMTVISVEDRQNRMMRTLWRDFLSTLLRSEEPGEEGDSITLAIVYLATNGLWQAEIEGVFEGTPELHGQITERLKQLTLPVDTSGTIPRPVSAGRSKDLG